MNRILSFLFNLNINIRKSYKRNESLLMFYMKIEKVKC